MPKGRRPRGVTRRWRSGAEAESARLRRPRGATPHPRSGEGGGREELPHTPTPEAKGGNWEEQPRVQGAVALWAQEGLEELSHVEGQEGQQ